MLEAATSTRGVGTVIYQPTRKAGEKSVCKGFICFFCFISSLQLKEIFKIYIVFFSRENISSFYFSRVVLCVFVCACVCVCMSFNLIF